MFASINTRENFRVASNSNLLYMTQQAIDFSYLVTARNNTSSVLAWNRELEKRYIPGSEKQALDLPILDCAMRGANVDKR